jgi:uncharacterized membrane protein YjgN (DUF898 family)
MPALHLPHFERDEHPRLATLLQLFWGSCAVIVLLFILLSALRAIDPTDVVILTAAVLAIAVLWLAHAWLGLWRDERRMR